MNGSMITTAWYIFPPKQMARGWAWEINSFGAAGFGVGCCWLGPVGFIKYED